MLCPVCESSYVVAEKNVYDSYTDEVCECKDCSHTFARENAIPYTMKLPEKNPIGDID